MSQNKKIVDGCTAAAYVAYALSDVATVYPITPIASMGETAQKWAMSGLKNMMGQPLQVKEMESELGAAGATHGALAAGALATTFTASQGLMLMIPNMYKIAGELLPAVFHVGCRSLATHALSIFGDHQDVMACRATGFAMLASANVQETHDLGIVAHLAAIEGSVPVLHFFDGWRTSNEMSTVSLLDYDTIFSLVDKDKVQSFRRAAMNPEHPDLRGSAQNADVYFQNREAANRYYDAFPAIVKAQMDKLAAVTGRHYNLVDYHGAPDATEVIVAIGSSCDVIAETVDYLNSRGARTGLIKITLYRPFPAADFVKAIPDTVKTIAVLDRTKEPGSQGEPLCLDVAAAVQESGRVVRVIGGRYGLSSKEFDPSMVKAVFDEAARPDARRRFTVGINDDVTHLSLDVTDHIDLAEPGLFQARFYGMGSDGTVGATKQAAHIIGDNTDKYAQAYFQYSAKKSGGYTVSQLRIGDAPIRAQYGIEAADYIACNKDTYVDRFELVEYLRPGGTFVLNASWTADELNDRLPASLRRAIAAKQARFYTIDAQSIAAANGLGVRINMIMIAAFFKLTSVIPYDTAIGQLKKLITSTYMHEGAQVVDRNIAALAAVPDAIKLVDYPASWAEAADPAPVASDDDRPEFVTRIADPCNRLEGNSLPVSLFDPAGIMPAGTTAYEKRRIAINIPQWDPDKCVECALCSLVCAHAAIRPVVMTADEAKAAPADFVSRPMGGASAGKGLLYRIQVYPEDCTGCGSCSVVCPGHALTMVPLEPEMQKQIPLLDFARKHVTPKGGLEPRHTIRGSQLYEPLLEFSGACAGCGETPYVKLLTQLMGERMLIANATGCSSIWGANFPSNAYCTNCHGHGPAWGNSLFEDNAEYGFGMLVAVEQRRDRLALACKAIVADKTVPAAVSTAASAWLAAKDDPATSFTAGRALLSAIAAAPQSQLYEPVTDGADMLARKSVWAIGGDGWAYDIGFAGLDHVLAQNKKINILVMDTECYSNTGGQMSKATPLGAVAKYAADGKRTFKKDLGRMMMTYGNVYVASICLGANYQQAITAMMEAEAYDGPSIVIAYCPCINHGIRAGMGHDIIEERNAVLSGYWQLYRYNPALAAQGREPLTVDMAAPDGKLVDFINGEDRYADLRMIDPATAAVLQPELQEHAEGIYDILATAAKKQ
ncbi:MAG: pyruvate:ferredoxin (flavodoxin) oxidoreductase [Muribaculaceae bacterium]|nr:pyruvate:ferredoxin (flavodoxin) oxidoreductase [Muribaculaceae bacterium]